MKILKKFLIGVSVLIVLLYALFFVLVYAFGDLNKYKNEIQKVVKETVGLDLNYQSAKLSPTPKVEIKLNINNLTLNYLNSKEIAKIDNLSVKLPVLPIIFGNIKLSEIKIDNPKAEISLNKKGEIDLVTYLEPYLVKMNENNVEPDEETALEEKTETGLPKYFNISTKMPDLKIKKYNISVFDEEINNTVSINGDKLDIVKFDLSKGLKVITNGKISIPSQTFANYDVSIETFLPEMGQENKTQQPQTQFIDPFKSMIKYGFYTDIFADLKISENKTDGINITGNLDIKELNLKSNTTDTKGTYAKLKFDKNTVKTGAMLYLSKSQKADIKANINYGKKTNIEMDVKSDKLDLVHFTDIAQALCNTLMIDNDFGLLKVSGYISPNFSIKSDMKKILSSGQIHLKEGQILHKDLPANVSGITSEIDLSGNKITIMNTKALVNGQPINVSGTVKQDATCDLKINSNNLSLPSLFELFADKSLKNTYKITSGLLNFDVKIKGKLDKIMPEVTAKISNLNLTDKINHYTLNAPTADLLVTTDLKTYKGAMTLGTTKVTLPDFALSTLVKNFKATFDEKNMAILPFDLDIQNSILKTEGIVKYYASDMNYEIQTSGNLSTAIIKNFVPKEFQSMISNKGALPVKANISGDASAINMKGTAGANSSNYITPIHITQLLNKPSTLKFDIKTKGNDLIINDISLDTASTHFADIKGQINSYAGKQPIFKNLKINTPNSFSFSIPDMQNSLITLTSNLTVGGTMNAPVILGNINISNLSVPQFKLAGKDVAINLTNSAIKASSNDIKIADSDIQFNMNADNKFGKIFVINNMTVNSNNFNLGKILTVMTSMPQNSYAPGTDFPLMIKSGHGNIKNFKMDAITAQNADADFSMSDNTLYLKNLKTKSYGGNVEGDLSYNLQYLRLKTKLKGQNLNANSAVTAFTGLKDQMNGNLNFNADFTMSGAEYKQQMQTLKGSASFVILDGQMGSLGKFEHFLYAQNLLSQKFVKTTLGSIASNLAPKNTGKFTKMSGDIGLSNGWAQIVQLTSTGPNMSLYLTGKFNLLNNNANIDILGKISKEVANSLGVVSDLSLEKLTSTFTSKFGTTLNKVISGYNVTATKDNLNKIPALSTGVTEGTKSFKVKIDGNIESVSAVKSFMWLMSEAEAEAKKRELIQNSEILNKLPGLKETILNQTGASQTTQNTTTQTKTETSTQSTPQTQKTIPTTKEELKEGLKNEVKNQLKNQINKNLPNFLNDIGTNKN